MLLLGKFAGLVIGAVNSRSGLGDGHRIRDVLVRLHIGHSMTFGDYLNAAPRYVNESDKMLGPLPAQSSARGVGNLHMRHSAALDVEA